MSDLGWSQRWDPGMVLPRGDAPHIRMNKEDLKNCPRDGEGTLDNPLVIWVARLTDQQKRELVIPEFEDEADLYRAVDSNADIAKTAAIRCGCTVVWIVCPVHTTNFQRRRNGHITNGDDRTFELFEWSDKRASNLERERREAAEYIIFKTMTVNCEGWELEDLGNDDTDYVLPEAFDTLYQNNQHYKPAYHEVAELDPELDDYLIQNWSPYREHSNQ
ncbi:hypothetical protein M426DRAFT_27164 [Hypoxylon sp. CI-4A]|nr:hypothetical protein M426DRAFT_27164 [Hypoxylon sp. CI-4A]